MNSESCSGHLWLRADPEKAIKTLFSRRPDYFKDFRGNIPFYQIQNGMKWDAARVGKLLDDIEDPGGRAIVYQEWLVWRMRELPNDKYLKEIIALDDGPARERAIRDIVYRAMMSQKSSLIDQILSIPAQHSFVRDRILMHYIIETHRRSSLRYRACGGNDHRHSR